MRTTKSKNQNKKTTPKPVVFATTKSLINYLQKSSTKKKEALCLIKGKELYTCTHPGCILTNKYPQYYSNTKGKRISDRQDFYSFKMMTCAGGSSLIAINPYVEGTKEHDRFELFRNGWSELMTAGSWPDRTVFSRDEISIEFVEYRTFRMNYNPKTNDIDKEYHTDVREAAFFNDCNKATL